MQQSKSPKIVYLGSKACVHVYACMQVPLLEGGLELKLCWVIKRHGDIDSQA